MSLRREFDGPRQPWVWPRVVAGLAVVGLTTGGAWMVSNHHAAPKLCAVTLYVDGHWAPAPTSDQDALHYSCGVTP